MAWGALCHTRATRVNHQRTIANTVQRFVMAILDRRANEVQTIAMTEMDRVLARGRARRAWRAEPAGVARFTRERAGLTQREMAALLGVDRSAVSRWEAGVRAPRAAVLERYLQVLERVRGRGEILPATP